MSDGREAAAAELDSRFDLLRAPLVGGFLRWRHARSIAQSALGLLALLILLDGWFGPALAPKNLAGVLPWVHWRGLAVLALLLAGNLFCFACPFMLPRRLAKRLFPASRPWPRWFGGKWVALGLLALFFWAYEAFSLWASPWLTAWLVVAYFAGACAVDAVFRGAAFCKHACPIGQFNFVLSTVSPLEVRVRSTAVCVDCQTKDCISGRAIGSHWQNGCELWLFQPAKVGNLDCTFCLDCVQACPHDNVGLIGRWPGAELVGRVPIASPRGDRERSHPSVLSRGPAAVPRPSPQGDHSGSPLRGMTVWRTGDESSHRRQVSDLCHGERRAKHLAGSSQPGDASLDAQHDRRERGDRPSLSGDRLALDWRRSGIGLLADRPDFAALVVVLTAGAILSAYWMTPLARPAEAFLGGLVGPNRPVELLLGFGLGLGALPFGLVWLVAESSRRLGGLVESPARVAARQIWSLAPLACGIWTAHYSYHFLTGALTLVPVFQSYLTDLGLPGLGAPRWGLGPVVPFALLQPLELAWVEIGLLGSLLTAYRLAGNVPSERRIGTWLPWAALAVVLSLVAAWVLVQPMEMRGTLGAG